MLELLSSELSGSSPRRKELPLLKSSRLVPALHLKSTRKRSASWTRHPFTRSCSSLCSSSWPSRQSAGRGKLLRLQSLMSFLPWEKSESRSWSSPAQLPSLPDFRCVSTLDFCSSNWWITGQQMRFFWWLFLKLSRSAGSTEQTGFTETSWRWKCGCRQWWVTIGSFVGNLSLRWFLVELQSCRGFTDLRTVSWDTIIRWQFRFSDGESNWCRSPSSFSDPSTSHFGENKKEKIFRSSNLVRWWLRNRLGVLGKTDWKNRSNPIQTTEM